MIYDEDEHNVTRTFDIQCYGDEKSQTDLKKEVWGVKKKKFKYLAGVKQSEISKYI